WALEAVAMGGILLSIGMLVLFWSSLPALVPTHFGVSGDVDAWGDKRTLLILPGVSLILYLTLTIASRFPHKFNYPWPITAQNAGEQYHLARSLLAWLKAETIILFAIIEWMTIRTALGQANGLGVVFLPFFMVVIFGTTGFYFYYAYQAR
ncbi:MAG: DUF1648 domain-containing protein, partial [Chloroflexi bacterium]|nr:DUF1648 domain-containing protein [Chloroflexota bacterium]